MFAISSVTQSTFARSLLYIFPKKRIDVLSAILMRGYASRFIAILSNHKMLPNPALARLSVLDITLIFGGLNVQFSNHSGVTGCPAYGGAVPIVLIAHSNSLVIVFIWLIVDGVKLQAEHVLVGMVSVVVWAVEILEKTLRIEIPVIKSVLAKILCFFIVFYVSDKLFNT